VLVLINKIIKIDTLRLS